MTTTSHAAPALGGAHRDCRVDVHIPELGTVRWTPAEVGSYAHETTALHRPDVRPHRWSLRPPFRHRTGALCASCSQFWPCRSQEWSTWWFDVGATRTGGDGSATGRSRRSGRHRNTRHVPLMMVGLFAVGAVATFVGLV